MFGFEHVKMGDEDGSQDRFYARQRIYTEKKQPQIKHYFWWLVHNCVAHPLIGVFPTKVMFDLHDWTSHKIMADFQPQPTPPYAKPDIVVGREILP